MWNPGFVRPIRALANAMSGWGRPREGHIHAGVDIPVPVGTPVYAMAEGQVVRVQATNAGDAAGIWVGIRHPSGLVSRYMHMSKTSVSLNQAVQAGQVIGMSGNTGIHSSGPHLHVDLKAPTALLPLIEQAGGKPSTGWGPSTSYGVGIPAEPWVPVDSYNARTTADAKVNGIPLYRPIATGIVTLLGAGVLAWAAYHLVQGWGSRSV